MWTTPECYPRARHAVASSSVGRSYFTCTGSTVRFRPRDLDSCERDSNLPVNSFIRGLGADVSDNVSPNSSRNKTENTFGNKNTFPRFDAVPVQHEMPRRVLGPRRRPLPSGRSAESCPRLPTRPFCENRRKPAAIRWRVTNGGAREM